MSDYTASEMMIAASARELVPARVVFVGIGLPNIACNLAQRTVAPRLELVYEAGVYGAHPSRLPLSIGDPCLVTGATAVVPMPQASSSTTCKAASSTWGFWGGADRSLRQPEHDRHRRLSAAQSTFAGQRRRVRNRPDVPPCADHRTSQPSHLRRETGLCHQPWFPGRRRRTRPPGRLWPEPMAVITDMGVFRFDAVTHEMTLASLHPGAAVSRACRSRSVAAACGARPERGTTAPTERGIAASCAKISTRRAGCGK